MEDTRCIHNNGDQCNIAQRGRRDARINTNTNANRNTNTNANRNTNTNANRNTNTNVNTNTNTNTNVVADGKGR